MVEKYDKILVSYILGIVSVVMSLFSPVVAVALGIVGLFHIKGEKGSLRKRAKILNIIGIIIGLIVFIVYFLIFTLQVIKSPQFPIA